MYPVGIATPFPYQFVHAGQGLQEGEVLPTLLHRWQIDVCRFATHVVAVLGTSHCLVQFGATIAARYADRAEPVAQGLEHHVAQVCQVQHLLHAGAFVLYAKSLGGVRASELAQTEVV